MNEVADIITSPIQVTHTEMLAADLNGSIATRLLAMSIL